MKKVKFILLAIVVVIVIAGVCGFVFLKDKITISARSKAEKGFSKSLNIFEESEELLSSNDTYKYLEDIDSKAIESEVSMNFDADFKNLESLVEDEDLAEIINNAIEELSNADITTKVGMDKKNKKLVVSGNVNAENIFGTISGEAVVEEDQMAFRSKEFNEKFIKVTKDDEGMEQVFDIVKEMFETDYNKITLTDEEIEHFKTTYGDAVLDKVITDDKISSEKGEFTVNDKTKSCTVTKVTIDNETVKELIKAYIDQFKNDEEGKNIIKSKLEIYNKEDISLDELEENLDSLKEEIDEIEGVSMEFITYGSLFDVYGTEFNLTIDEETLNIVETFNKDKTNIVVKFADEELAKIDITQSSENLIIDANITANQMACNVNIEINDKLMNFKFNADNIATVEFSVNVDTQKSTEKELEQNVKLNGLVNIPVANIDTSFNVDLSEKTKVVDSLELPDTSDSISLDDEDEIEKYMTDCQENAQSILKKLEESDIYKAILDYNSSSKSSSFDYDDWDTEATEDDEEIDPSNLKANIQDWYKELDVADGSTKTETIEDDMISSLEFDDYVDVTTYISWKEGDKSNEGYLGIQLTDLDDNEYEYYVDLSKDIVYDKDDVPFDTEKVEWNEY